MPILRDLISRKAMTVTGDWTSAWPGRTSAAGVTVTPEGALGLVAVYSAATLIAGAGSSLPTRILNAAGDMHTPQKPDQYRALWDRPNPLMTRQAMTETALLSMLLWGNAYEGLTYDMRGELVERWPIDPARVTRVTVDKASGAIAYDVRDHGTVVVGRDEKFPQLLHVAGPTLPGRVLGMSPIETVMNHIGLSHAIERTAAGFYKNGMNPAGTIEVKGKMTRDTAREYAARMQDAFGGVEKAGKWAVMDEGSKMLPLTIPPIQAQFVEQQRYSDRKIASIFRVPPHLISDVDASTSWGSGIEEQTMSFGVYTLTPWLTRIEQAIEARLLRGTGYQYRHMLQGLMRGNTAARNAAYSAGRLGGWLSVNDIRRMEDMPGIGEDGDVFLSPLNMEPASDAATPAPLAA